MNIGDYTYNKYGDLTRKDFYSFSSVEGIELDTASFLISTDLYVYRQANVLDTMTKWTYSPDKPGLKGGTRTIYTYEAKPTTNQATNFTQKGLIILYPNPADKLISIQADRKLNVPGNLHITDITGRIMSKHDLSPGATLQIDISSYARGLYILSFKSKQGSTVLKWYKN